MPNLILNSLEIHNFRAFHDLKIDHLRRVNLIVGKNNIGKTSLFILFVSSFVAFA
jgi:AAA15 family ATPase/GTPase